MKKLLTSYFFLLASSFLAAKADLLYFMAEAYDPTGWKYFDYAMIGVSKKVNNSWTETWGDDGSKMYLHLYDSENATLGSSSAAASEDQVAANISAYTIGSDDERYCGVGWADVSNYMTAEYKFYVEAYSNGKDEPVMSRTGEAKSYAELLAANHIYTVGMTDSQNVTAWMVPEPSSGLLLLFGLAGFALLRKRGCVCSRRITNGGKTSI